MANQTLLSREKVQEILSTFRSQMRCRPDTKDAALADVLTGLLDRYFERVPDAAKVFYAATKRGDIVKNDHVAFRSLNMQSLLKIFLPYDYQVRFENQEEKIPFNFVSKKLTAIWLKHPNPDMPRIFISEIRLDELPELAPVIAPYLQAMNDTVDTLKSDDPAGIVKYLHTGLWPTPTHKDYLAVSEHSEYLAWVLYNEYYLNHFTLTVNALQSFNFQSRIEHEILASISAEALEERLEKLYQNFMNEFNQFLKSQGLTLNAPGGKALNISPDHLLLQSSTKANLVRGHFQDGEYEVPGSYVEFAYRGILPDYYDALLRGDLLLENLNDSHLRDGFETANADKIFESTYTRDPETGKADASGAFEASRERLLGYLDTRPKQSLTQPPLQDKIR